MRDTDNIIGLARGLRAIGADATWLNVCTFSLVAVQLAVAIERCAGISFDDRIIVDFSVAISTITLLLCTVFWVRCSRLLEQCFECELPAYTDVLDANKVVDIVRTLCAIDTGFSRLYAYTLTLFVTQLLLCREPDFDGSTIADCEMVISAIIMLPSTVFGFSCSNKLEQLLWYRLPTEGGSDEGNSPDEGTCGGCQNGTVCD